MDAQLALATLRHNEAELRKRGVRHAALFGSVARGDNRPDSNIDVFVEFDPTVRVTVFDYIEVKDFVAGLFPEHVDVIDRDALKPALRAISTRDALYAF